VGRLVVIGGCDGDVLMVGAPAMAATAAFRSGVGLVQVFVPAPLRTTVAIMAPCATTRTLPTDAAGILTAVDDFKADVLAIGPGLGRSIEPPVLADVLTGFAGPIVVDADGLNLLAETEPFDIPNARRLVLTPHPGELHRLLAARGMDRPMTSEPTSRRAAACALVEAYGCTAVLKGFGTIVTNGDRMYINETGNAGMASGGTGDVLTGVIAGLIGQRMAPMEAAILGVYLHGLAGDFAAEELGRRSLTATDMIEYLPEAFSEYEMTEGD
jgi:NAD(P)H-hydrate epimerase